MMRIKMLKTQSGSENGFIVKQFCRHKIYNVQDMLARSFIRDGVAVRVYARKKH